MPCGGGVVPVGRPAHAHGWCSRVVLTGWQAASYARARKRRAARGVAHGTTVVSSGSCSGELCLCITDCACVGEGCAACLESQWQRAPTLSVASVVECPRLATGLAVSIEASPELLGVSPKRRPQNAGGRSGTARERRRGGNQQKLSFPVHIVKFFSRSTRCAGISAECVL